MQSSMRSSPALASVGAGCEGPRAAVAADRGRGGGDGADERGQGRGRVRPQVLVPRDDAPRAHDDDARNLCDVWQGARRIL